MSNITINSKMRGTNNYDEKEQKITEINAYSSDDVEEIEDNLSEVDEELKYVEQRAREIEDRLDEVPSVSINWQVC